MSHALPDRLYINLFFRYFYGRFPNLKSPETFDDKLQWYKLYYRNPLMPDLVDKYKVREYVTEKGFGAILNDIYFVSEDVDQLDPASLPGSFILKATHGYNMNIICKDRNSLDWNKCRSQMKKWLKSKHYYEGREWAYKNIRPRIICEKYLENEGYGELIDYKFYCYDGKAVVVWVCTGRFSESGLKYKAFDMSWSHMPVSKGKPSSDLDIEKPDNFAEMQRIACTLSEGFPFIRVDLYSVDNRILFGELTFYPDSGVAPFSPDHYNCYFGDLFRLPERRTTS